MSKEEILDVFGDGAFPANVLSNFYENGFSLDGVTCASMEGFLQSLKTKNRDLQKQVCLLSGRKAKKIFKHRIQNLRWKLTGILYWQGKPMRRTSDEYQRLLDRAYEEMYANNAGFVNALIASEGKKLIHSVGIGDSRRTVLTEYEFLSRLRRLRERALRERADRAEEGALPA